MIKWTVPEKDFQAQLMQVVATLGGLAYHAHDSRREVVKWDGERVQRVLVGDADAKGYPDLTIVTRDKRVIWAELKSGKKQPTETQWVWLRGLPDHQAYLWRTDDLDAAVRIIQDGHRYGSGMIQDADGLNVQPLRIIQHEPTCITCRGLDKPLDIL